MAAVHSRQRHAVEHAAKQAVAALEEIARETGFGSHILVRCSDPEPAGLLAWDSGSLRNPAPPLCTPAACVHEISSASP